MVSVIGWSDLLTTMMSGISMTPAFSAWIESPEPGIRTRMIVSPWSTMSISAWPTPTVSMKTSSLPEASIRSAACRVASERPPRAPRLAIERMKTPASRKWSERRIRSPSRAPRVNGLEGSIERTATWRSALRISSVRAPIRVLFPTPGGPVSPTIRALPVRGKTSRTSSQPAGSSFSIRVIARARARLSPATSRSARSVSVRCAIRRSLGPRPEPRIAARALAPFASIAATACSTCSTAACSGATCGGDS